MKKHLVLLLFIMLLFINLLSCKRSSDIFIYSPPDKSSVPIQPYTIKVSQYYDSLFAHHPFQPKQIQDFDIKGDFMYLWAYGPYGLFEFNLYSKSLDQIYSFPSGDCIAADSGRVYWARFFYPTVDLFTRHNSQSIRFLFKPEYHVSGLQVYENKLYVLYQSDTSSPEGNLLESYGHNGNLIESISYPRETRYMAINRGIVYSVAYDSVKQEQVLSRFDLNSDQFLKDVESPSLDCSGIRSYGDYFFFTDYEKEMIGYVLVDEIEQRGK